MKVLGANDGIVVIGYDDEFGDAHFYTVVVPMREMIDAGGTDATIKKIISEVGLENVFLKRWIFENLVRDF